MKNIQVIDGANNCSYDIFAVTDDEFKILFPDPGQDIEFIEDAIARVGEDKLGAIIRPIDHLDILHVRDSLFSL